MKVKETGFRAIYKNYCVFDLEKTLKDKIGSVFADFEGFDEANLFLGYGYIDHEAGLTVEILALGKRDGEERLYFAPNDTVSDKIRIANLMDIDFTIEPEEKITEEYKEKVKIIKEGYAVSEKIEKTREMEFLDECRSPEYPDDIMVLLFTEELQPEGCWARIEDLGEGYFMGKLIVEPYQDFGIHLNDVFAFGLDQSEDGRVTAICDLSHKESNHETSNEELIKAMIVKFNANPNTEDYVRIISLLMSIDIWVPCNAVFSEEDQQQFLNLVEEAGDDLSKLEGKTVTSKDQTRLIPDILQSDEEYFFPVFTSIDEMGEYGNHFSKVGKSLIEVLPLARNNDKEISGIVVNAFSNPFPILKDFWDLIEEIDKNEGEE